MNLPGNDRLPPLHVNTYCRGLTRLALAEHRSAPESAGAAGRTWSANPTWPCTTAPGAKLEGDLPQPVSPAPGSRPAALRQPAGLLAAAGRLDGVQQVTAQGALSGPGAGLAYFGRRSISDHGLLTGQSPLTAFLMATERTGTVDSSSPLSVPMAAPFHAIFR